MNKTKKRNHQRLESDAANSCSWEGVSLVILCTRLLISFKAKNLLKSHVAIFHQFFFYCVGNYSADVILTLLHI